MPQMIQEAREQQQQQTAALTAVLNNMQSPANPGQPKSACNQIWPEILANLQDDRLVDDPAPPNWHRKSVCPDCDVAVI